MSVSLRRGVLEHLRLLHELGVEALPLPAAAPPAATPPPPSAAGSRAGTPVPPAAARAPRPTPPVTAAAADAGAALAAVRDGMGECTRCPLSASRSHIVFGVGRPDADLMFIGEGPGQEEDRQGEPFVGPAGKLLDRMIAAMGLSRGEVYIANMVKCRPPGNRNPREDEMASCRSFLDAQIDAVQPRALVALGKIAAGALLGEEIAITRARGRWRLYRGIPLMPTFHPAYLLRQYTVDNRRAVYDDLLAVKARLDGSGPD